MAGQDLGAFTRYTHLGNPFCTSREACTRLGLGSVQKVDCGPENKLRIDERYVLRCKFGELSDGMAFCNLRIFPRVGRVAPGGWMFLARRFYAIRVFLSTGLAFGFGRVTYSHVIGCHR